MANGNVKLSVSGVDQFKRGMKEAQTSVKTLDAELQKNEQQFRLTGDAEVYMEQKSEILKRQIEQQKEVVRQAEQALAAMKRNGVDPTSQAFQQMQQQLLRAQGSLMGMEADLNSVGAAGQQASSDVGGLKTNLDRLGSQVSFKNLTDGLDKITSKLKSAASAAWNLGKELVNATLGAGEWADELATDAKVYGISTDRLQRMQKTARIIDTDVDTIIKAQKRLKKELAGHSSGFMGAYAEILPGYDPTQHDWEDVFWDTGEAIMHMADAEKQEAYAQQIFGRSWADLIPLFEAGRKTYEETNAGWNVVSEEDLENLGKMDDQYQKLVSEWETFKYTLLATLSGPLTEVMEHLTSVMGRLNEYLQSEEGQEKLHQITSGLTTFFEKLVEVDPEQVMEAFAKALETVQKALEWVYEHWHDIVNGIKAIAAAFAGIQLASLAANLLSITNSLGWFKGGTPTTSTPTVPANGGELVTAAMTTFTTAIPLGFILEQDKMLKEKFEAQVAQYEDVAKEYGITPTEVAMAESLGMTPQEYIDELFDGKQRLPNGQWVFANPNMEQLNLGAYDPTKQPESFQNYWTSGQADRVIDLIAGAGAGQKNSLTSDDISEFRGLPAAIQEAAKRGIESANIRVVIQDDAMQDITNKTNTGFWNSVMSMVN